ncbi:glycosyl transferase family 2 [Photobacterium sp. GB-50]|uniref:glycosyl transferase family protein n=1 Tax=Photobacterium sp. GB-50 TaxID=2022107 RepID=UPI000D15B723|nr:glycosyl transferase family protein [Photobacterium sp. GB-50]PSW73424.1 glycosyl transferase family 2 [Photobacterium sp. GB-50]
MDMFDIFIYYLYGLRLVLFVTMVILCICGIDDLFVDIYYWVRHLWRKGTVYKKYTRKNVDDLYQKDEQPLAIMVPAWQEFGVIDKMAELTASSLDYENYQIFVGTYPNDPETQADVDRVCMRFPNVHKVVCARPGPTSKADCLNNIISSIIEFEKKAKIKFSGFILHDAEDIVSPMELRLYNYLLPEKDLIQLPVYPYTRKWYQMTPGHYADEFAELHGKDVVVRESIAGQVPSAGVGTCFSRRAILKLLVTGDGLAFDVQSLTEDYEIGLRLKQWGMSEIFVRFPIIDKEQPTLKESSLGVSLHDGSVVCVREHFPTTFSAAVRQKSRWIVGIVFQGFNKQKWTNDWKLNYFLWRDRRGFINNTIGFLSMVIFLQLVALSIYSYFVKDGYHFLSIIADNKVNQVLLVINTFLLINRLLQRFYFVSRYYGYFEGFLSLLRLCWGTVINFAANVRAIRQVIQQGDVHRVAWDKTTHDFPTLANDSRKQPLGEILKRNMKISEEMLTSVLLDMPKNRLIGSYLVEQGIVSNDDLSQAIAEQFEEEFEHCDPFELDPSLIHLLPKKLALKYSVLPLRKDGNTLILGKEMPLSPVAKATISRRLKCPVKSVITTNGAVTLGLRYWYLEQKGINPYHIIKTMVGHHKYSKAKYKPLIDKYYATQSQLGQCLLMSRAIEPAVLHQAILAYENEHEKSFGKFLINHRYVTKEVIDKALELQVDQQMNVDNLINECKQY